MIKACFYSLVAAFVFLSACKTDEVSLPEPPTSISLDESVYYHIDLNDRANDRFKVIGYFEGLDESNKIYQFPAVVPGTYRVSDIGRFVESFQAFDDLGNPVSTQQVSTNQWEFSDPKSVARISYSIAETWDTPVDTLPIYLMGGTSLETDHALINTFAVLGYPTGLKEREYYLELKYPEDWTVGTALEQSEKNLYWAQNYDYLVDSPLLLGRLSDASIQVDNTKIDIHTYSKTDLITSSMIQAELNIIMEDASAFLKVLPVDRYSFLFHFEDRSNGALEHSFSSVYVLRERALSENFLSLIKSISAHEFFHIVTPLNIRSSIIEDFNFAEPTPSAHLWLYEGVTEWASDIMQYRNGSIDAEHLLDELASKFTVYERSDKTISLEDISLKSYTEEGGSQFFNIYNRGALVAYMLDIRLLELSNGTFGLRELILKLIDTYGAENAFDDATFFQAIEDLTYPEIAEFISKFIQGTDELPIDVYFNKIGIDHDKEDNVFSIMSTPSAEQTQLFNQWKVNL
ncbi:MAG: peptidase [Cyclobacteriaceae bacterium]